MSDQDNKDGLVKIDDLEPDSVATTMNFRGRGDIRYIRQKRWQLPVVVVCDRCKTEVHRDASPIFIITRTVGIIQCPLCTERYLLFQLLEHLSDAEVTR